MSSRERAYRLHAILLALLGIPALALAGWCMLEADRSASAMSGLAMVMGIALAATVVAYALATGTIVRMLARSPKHTALVHATATLLGVAVTVLSR